MHPDAEKYSQLSFAIATGLTALSIEYSQDIANKVECWIDQIDVLFEDTRKFHKLSHKADEYRNKLKEVKK